LSTIDVSDPTADEDTMFRVVQFAGALDDIADSPLLGHGTSSFQLLFAPGAAESIVGTNVPWIANSELRILHDTGAIGLGLFLLFLGALLRKAWPLLRRGSEPALLALLTSAVVYCVSFQATEGTILAFPWVHLGLIGCVVAMELKNPRRGAGVPGK
jgi:O-antigen ligase